MRARYWAEGGGAALLLMLPFFFPLVAPGKMALYHSEFPDRTLILGVLLDLAAFAVLFAISVALVLRLPARARLLAGAVLAAGVLWRAGAATAELLANSQPSRDAHGAGNSPRLAHFGQTWLRLSHGLAAGMLLLFLLLAMTAPSLLRVIVRGTRIGLAGFSFSLVWLAPMLLYLAIRPAEPQVHSAEAGGLPVATSRPQQPRLVWILFDELSYRLVFDQRPAGQEFPNLEKLHHQSFSFDNVEPVGFYTDHVIPSVLSGKEIDEVRSTATGQLEYLGPHRQRWEAFNPEATLFGLAQRDGWNPGVAGWWNPYCRIFTSMLSECSWRTGGWNFSRLDLYGASSDKPTAANALVVPEYLVARALGTARSDIEQGCERHIGEYRSLMERAAALIQDRQIHFVFLHLPVPHPPGIYDRHTHRLRAGGNYLDNLTLADDTLGKLMQEIETSGDGDRTTVIVSSDHSWRVPLWDSTPEWTKEEEEISHDNFDPRPVFLIHFPGETNGVEIRSVVPELEEHDIIAGILNGQIENGSQMAALLHTEKIRVAGNEEERPEAGQ